MNRKTKRLLAKQERQAERERARSTPLVRGDGSGGGSGARGARAAAKAQAKARRGATATGEPKEGRIKRMRRFLREVRVELKKVAWPSRGEVVTYTIVVLFSVTVVTLLVFGLDFLFGEGVFTLFSTN